ncbi:MAG: ABC transporter permease [Anaerolineae bacterium]|nr:ABC transporter permease [Anaerolineae bacterium]
MSIYLRLAWRNVWRQRRRTWIVILGVGLGLALMMWYDGTVAGFEQAIYGNAIQVLGGNIQVHGSGYNAKSGQNPLIPIENDAAILAAAQAQPQVVAAAPRVATTGLASSRKGAFAVSIIGIDPPQEAKISLISQYVRDGRYPASDDKAVVLIGRGLAEVMNVGVGDRITLVGRTASKEVRRHKMTVVGIYDLGLREIEKRSVYIPLAQAQYLYGMEGQVSEIAISLHKMGGERAVMQALAPVLGGNEISSWETSYPEMRAALGNKNTVMNVFSVIILLIAAIGILNLLTMAVYERTREIGVLGALGMKPREISLLFLLEGGMMGLAGLVGGILLGLCINLLLGQIGLDYSQFAGITDYMALISGRIYPTLGLERIVQRGITVVVIALIAAYYPARQAGQRQPAEALHAV